MTSRRRTLAILAVATTLLAAPTAHAGPPTDALRDFFGAVSVVVGDPTTEDRPLERLRAIRRHVNDVFDFREAAMLALGREWAAHTPAEQNEFVALFADLIERSFVWRVAGKATLAGGVQVDYLNETASGDTATVQTEIAARDGNPLRIDYRMVRRSGRWVIRDIVMDGVSTMDNYHAQFQRVVRDSSWPDLIAQLRAKVGTPAGTVQVASAAPVPAAPPMMWPSELRAPQRISEPLTPVQPPPAATPAVATPAVAAPAPAVAAPEPTPTVARPAPAAVALPAQAPATAPAAEAVTVVVPPAVTAPPTAHPAPVVIARVEPPRPPVAPPMRAITVRQSPAQSAYWIQVGAFRSASAAGRAANQVRGEILVVASPAAAEPPLLRVRVGPFANRAHALARLRELQAQGWQAFIAQAAD
jgi:phospholipid transport system substrate-binding protein